MTNKSSMIIYEQQKAPADSNKFYIFELCAEL
jgi:hypothetical protein